MPAAEPKSAESRAAARGSEPLARAALPPVSFSLRQLARQWAPPLLWMIMILVASSDWLAASETEGLLRRILTALFGSIPDARFHLIHFVARKSGHAVAYAILTWLAYRSARGPAPAAPAWSWRPLLCALGFSFVTACLDEAHQVFTQARTGSAWDVALDMSGVLLALAVIWVASKRKAKAAAES